MTSGLWVGQVLDDAPGRAFPAAVFTDAVNLKGMAGGLVVVLAADLLLELVNLRREELD